MRPEPQIPMYIDVFFALNGWMDLLVLFLTGRLLGRKTSPGRLFLGAGLGGLFSCLYLWIPTDSVAVRLSYSLFTAFFMAGAVFYPFRKKEGLKTLLCLYLTAAVVSGLLQLVGDFSGVSGALFFLGTGTLVPVLSQIGSRLQRMQRKASCRYRAELVLGERRVVLEALLDTGNHLYTMAGCRPVHLAERAAVEELLGEAPPFLPVPYRSVGNPEGILWAVTLDRLTLRQGDRSFRLDRPVIGLYEGALSSGGEYRMLLHADTGTEKEEEVT